jgi:hypothetical protein
MKHFPSLQTIACALIIAVYASESLLGQLSGIHLLQCVFKQGLSVHQLQIEYRSASSCYLEHNSSFRLSTSGAGERSAAKTSFNPFCGTGVAMAMTGVVLRSRPLVFDGGKLTADVEAAHNAGNAFTTKGNERRPFQEPFDKMSHQAVRAIAESPELRQITPSHWNFFPQSTPL